MFRISRFPHHNAFTVLFYIGEIVGKCGILKHQTELSYHTESEYLAPCRVIPLYESSNNSKLRIFSQNAIIPAKSEWSAALGIMPCVNNSNLRISAQQNSSPILKIEACPDCSGRQPVSLSLLLIVEVNRWNLKIIVHIDIIRISIRLLLLYTNIAWIGQCPRDVPE